MDRARINICDKLQLSAVWDGSIVLTGFGEQKSIRDFLRVRTSYDVLPLSYRLIILNTDLLVKKSLTILLQNGKLPIEFLWDTCSLTVLLGIVSAPLWDSNSSTFAGLLTTADYINVIQYYWQNPDALNQIDQFRLSSLRGNSMAVLMPKSRY